MTPSSVPDLTSPSSTSSSSNPNQLYVQTSIFNLANSKEITTENKSLSSSKTNFPITDNSIQSINNSTCGANELINNHSNGLLNILTNNNCNNLLNLGQETNEHKLVLNKIGHSPPVTPNHYKQHNRHQLLKSITNNVSKKTNINDLKDTNCNVCSRFSKLFCICDVSKSALNRLYRNCADFNTHYYDTTMRRSNAETNTQVLIECESKIFEIL